MSIGLEVIGSHEFAATVADEIVSLANQFDKNSVSIALAGGSTPGEVYRQLLVEPRASEMPWDKILFFIGDERWVPLDDPQSNYHMACETFLNKKLGSKVYPITGKDPESAAKEYENKVKDLTNNQLDLVLLGMGEDGHTASIFPNSNLLSDKSGNTVKTCTHPESEQIRISFMPELILNASRILVLVKGKGKAEMLKRVFEGDDSINELPIKMLWNAKGKVTFFADSEAAKLGIRQHA